MQHIADVPQTSAVTIASIVTAAAADEGVDQPYQQPLAIAAAPFSFEESAVEASDIQIHLHSSLTLRSRAWGCPFARTRSDPRKRQAEEKQTWEHPTLR
jgi:hypothetical protein